MYGSWKLTVAPLLLEQADHVERRALAHVVDVALVRDAEHEDAAAVHRLAVRR